MQRITKTLLIIFCLTFFLKLGLGIYFSQLSACQFEDKPIGSISLSAGDTFSYIGAVENLIEKNIYYFEDKGKVSLAGRMPYYGSIYYLLRLFADKSLASDIYVVLQILIDALATVFFALLVFDIFKSKWLAYLGYVLYFCSFNLFVTTLALVPESLSLSLFVIFLYLFHQYWKTDSKKLLLLSGFLLGLVVVLKPYLIIVYPITLLAAVFKHKSKFNLQILLKTGLILSLPLLILLFPWIVRNAVVLGKFIPAQENLTGGYNYTAGDFAFRRFVTAWGGNIIFWDPQSAGCYFYPKPTVPCTFQLPGYALTEQYGVAEIEDVRKDYLELQVNYSEELEKKVVEKFDRLTNIYKAEKPLMYHIFSRVLLMKGMFWNTNNENLPIHPSFKCYRTYQILFKLIQFFIYASSMILGSLGIIVLVYQRKVSPLFISVPILIVAFFAFVKFVEPRYFIHAYPIMVIGLVGTVNLVREKLTKTNLYEQDSI